MVGAKALTALRIEPRCKVQPGYLPDMEGRVGTNPGAGARDKMESASDPGLQGGRPGEVDVSLGGAL